MRLYMRMRNCVHMLFVVVRGTRVARSVNHACVAPHRDMFVSDAKDKEVKKNLRAIYKIVTESGGAFAACSWRCDLACDAPRFLCFRANIHDEHLE